jgi:hypothetical protein
MKGSVWISIRASVDIHNTRATRVQVSAEQTPSTQAGEESGTHEPKPRTPWKPGWERRSSRSALNLDPCPPELKEIEMLGFEQTATGYRATDEQVAWWESRDTCPVCTAVVEPAHTEADGTHHYICQRDGTVEWSRAA